MGRIFYLMGLVLHVSATIWLLQFGFAIIPYFARRQFQPKA